MNTKQINLWSGPRNISTALMYSFAQRSDTKVVDEPLYAYYLSNSPAKTYHPGAQSVIDNMECDGLSVVKNLQAQNTKPIHFYKQMTHHLLDIDKSFLLEMDNIILTRDPRDMLKSFSQQIEEPKMQDVGYAAHAELVTYLRKQKKEVVVIDSKRLQNDPKKVLKKLCARLDIVFQEDMLSWQAGPIPEDGIWAPYWYKNVHESTGFKPHKEKKSKLPEHLHDLYNECLPIYVELSKLAL